MLHMTSLSANLNCEPPLAVFLALKMHSETRSKKKKEIVELLHKYTLGVCYKKVLTIDINFAQAIADQTRNNADIVCRTNVRQHIFIVAALGSQPHITHCKLILPQN